MVEWMYMHSLPLEDHPMGCQCDGCLSESWDTAFENESDGFPEPTMAEMYPLELDDGTEIDPNDPFEF